MNLLKKKNLFTFLTIILSLGLIPIASAFIGPTAGCLPGSTSGCGSSFSVDANGNVGFGTTKISGLGSSFNTPPSGSFQNVFMVASTSTPPGIALRNVGTGGSSNGTYGLADATWVWQLTPWGAITLTNAGQSYSYNRNAITVFPDNRVVFPGPTGTGSGWYTPTSTLNVLGDIGATGGFVGNGTNLTSISPSSLSGSSFSTANYAFPLSLAVGTTTIANLPQVLSVYGNGYFSGNVGIGTTNPYIAKLHIDKAVSGDIGGALFITNTATAAIGNKVRLGFDLVGFDDITPTASIDSRLSNTNGASDLIFNAYDGSGVLTNYERMRILGSNGNVGIGTNAPGAILDVKGQTANGTAYIHNDVATNWPTLVVRQTTAGGNGNQDIGLIVDIQGAADTDNIANFRYYDGAAYNSRMVVKRGGNVGIATTTPGYPLTVAGTIYSSTGGYRFPDGTTQTTAFAGGTQVTNASYVSAGVFGSNSTKGNYEFQHFNSTANVMYVDATNDRVGIGTVSPQSKLMITGGSSYGMFRLSPSVADGERTIGFFRDVAGTDTATAWVAGVGGWGNTNKFTIGYTSAPNLTIDTSGNVGIGTTGPGVKLHVYENLTSVAAQRIVNVNAAGYSGIEFMKKDNSTVGTYFGLNNDDTYFRMNLIDKPLGIINGNVGIGTTAPQELLTLRQTGEVVGPNLKITSGMTNGTTYMGGLLFGIVDGAPDTVISAIKAKEHSANSYGLEFIGYGAVGSPGTIMTLLGSGNVGIATTTPGYPLTVAGTIYSSTGGYRFPDGTTQTTAFAGGSQTINASYVSAGVFGSNSTKGNYEFQHSNTTANVMYVDATNDRVGIGTASPVYKLEVASSTGVSSIAATGYKAGADGIYSTLYFRNTASGMATIDARRDTDNYGTRLDFSTGLANAYGGGDSNTNIRMTINNQGNVGIGTTGPNSKLSVMTAGTSGVPALGTNSNGFSIVRSSDGVVGMHFGYNTANGDGYIQQQRTDSAVAYNLLLQPVGGNVGIGTTTPITARLVITPGAQPAIDVGSQKIIGLGYPSISTDAASVQYVSDAITNAVGGTSTSTGSYVLKSGDTMSGNLNMGGNNISGVNKLYVTTIDPVYQIGGVKYATYVSSIVGGVKEEYVGRGQFKITNDRMYEYAVDFDKVERGSDLWVWKNAVDFNADNVEILATPIGTPVPIAYEINGNKITFRADASSVIGHKSIIFSYRLIGKRFDWADNPTQLKDQGVKSSFICETEGKCKINTN